MSVASGRQAKRTGVYLLCPSPAETCSHAASSGAADDGSAVRRRSRAVASERETESLCTRWASRTSKRSPISAAESRGEPPGASAPGPIGTARVESTPDAPGHQRETPLTREVSRSQFVTSAPWNGTQSCPPCV